MSFIYRDANAPSRMKLNAMHAIHNKMKRAWGTSMINGIEVYNEKLYFYKNKRWIRTKPLERFLKSLGIELGEFYSQKFDKEIDDVWFHLGGGVFQWDGSKAGEPKNGFTGSDSTTHSTTAKDIVDTFDEAFEIGKEYKVTVQYGGPTKRYLDSHNLTWKISDLGIIDTGPLDSQAIRDQIESDLWLYLANARNMSTGTAQQFQRYDGGEIDIPNHPNKPNNRLTGACIVSTTFEGHQKATSSTTEPMYELAMFAPMSEGVFERIDGSLEDKISTYTSTKLDGEVLTYEYTYTYIYKGINKNSKLVEDILKYYATEPTFKLNNKLQLGTNLDRYNRLTSVAKDTDMKRVLTKMKTYIDPNTGAKVYGYTDSLWYSGRLRVDKARFMRRSDFVTMISTCIDTDYEVEKAEWWEILIAVVIVVISIVVFIYTLGASATITPTLIASSAGYSGMTLAVGGLVLNQLGGLSTQGLVEMIGAFAQIVGIVAMIAGIGAALQKAGEMAAKKAVEEAVKKGVTTTVRDELLKQTLLDQIEAFVQQSIDSAMNAVTDFTTGTITDVLNSVSEALKLLNTGLEMYADQEAKELQKDLEAYQKEEDAYNQEVLNNALKSPADVLLVTLNNLGSYDALTNLNTSIQNKIGQDDNYLAWKTNIASI